MQLPTLNRVIARIESGGNQFAMRTEGAKFDKFSRDGARFDQIGHLNKCSVITAQMIAATSWGMFQLMGFNLYGVDLNLQCSVGEFLSNVELQNLMFNRFLDANHVVTDVLELRDNPTAREHFAKAYNGPGNYLMYADLLSSTIISLTMQDTRKAAQGPDVA